MTERCGAYYDGDEPSKQTHTCANAAGHDGPHYCPRCGARWDVTGIAEED